MAMVPGRTFSPVGPYRALCDECGALLKNREIGLPDYNDPDGEYVRMEKRP